MDTQSNMVARAYAEVHLLKKQLAHVEARAACLEQERSRLVRIQGLQRKLCGDYAEAWQESQERCRSLEAQVRELEARLLAPAPDGNGNGMHKAG